MEALVPADGRMASGTVESADGTSLVYEISGRGRPVVIVAGGLGEIATHRELAELLSAEFTVLNYGRRGRSGSGDNGPYKVGKEIEDLAVMLALMGRDCAVFGNCTGGILAVDGVGGGLPISRLAVYEPPYVVEGGRRPAGPNYLPVLERLVDEGRRGDAVALFQQVAVGLSEDFTEEARKHPIWPSLEALAHTLVYDAKIVGDEAPTSATWDGVTVPSLVIDGSESLEWLRAAARMVADGVPHAERHTLDGQSHLFAAAELAPVLIDFFTE